MSFEWQTLFLSAVQGVTEFLPVSSSGHLALLQTAFGFSGSALAFDVLLHCATTLAVLIFFRKDIAAILGQWCAGLASKDARAEGWRYGGAVLGGTAVTAVVALPLRIPVEAAMNSRLAVGAGLLATAGILCLVPLLPDLQKGVLSLKTALVVGLVQGLAVFPGVSRSGATLAAALFMGLAAPEAFRLSFLLSVPAILGATLLEVPGLLRGA